MKHVGSPFAVTTALRDRHAGRAVLIVNLDSHEYSSNL
jgi:hypothetical protein